MSKHQNRKAGNKLDDNGRSFVKNRADFHPQENETDVTRIRITSAIEEWQSENADDRQMTDLEKQELEQIAEKAQIAGYQEMSKLQLERVLGIPLH